MKEAIGSDRLPDLAYKDKTVRDVMKITYIDSGGEIVQQRVNEEVAAIATTPQPVLLDTILENGNNDVYIKQTMKDRNGDYFLGEYVVPRFAPPMTSIGMKNKFKWVSEIGDAIGWRDSDEDVKLDWKTDVVGETPDSPLYAIPAEQVTVISDLRGELAAQIVAVDKSDWLVGVGKDFVAKTSGKYIVYADIKPISEEGASYNVAPPEYQGWFLTMEGSGGATLPWGVMGLDGYIVSLTDMMTLVPPYSEAQVQAIAIGNYDLQERMQIIVIVDLDAATYDIYKNGELLQSAEAFTVGAHTSHDEVVFSCAGSLGVSYLYSLVVADHGTEADLGWQFRYIGVEGSVAKSIAPSILAHNEVKIVLAQIRKSIYYENDIRQLSDLQLSHLAPLLTGVDFVGPEDKRKLIQVLARILTPQPETIVRDVEEFTGSTLPGQVYTRDISEMLWAIRIPKPLPLDALWDFAHFANYEWLADKIKPLATNVLVEWYYSIVDSDPWSPESWVELFHGAVTSVLLYHYHAVWGGLEIKWDDGAWGTPTDWVALQ